MPNQCPECGNKLYHNEGISKKTGKPYENFKCGKCEYIKWVNQGEEKKVDGNTILADEINDFRKEFNERMDSLGEYLVKHLEK